MPKTFDASRPVRGLKPLARLFKALADEHRLCILTLLARHGELSVSAMGRYLGQSQPAVSHHLKQLTGVGLIGFRRDGKFNYYALSGDGLRLLFDEVFEPAAGATKLAFGGVEVTVKRK